MHIIVVIATVSLWDHVNCRLLGGEVGEWVAVESSFWLKTGTIDQILLKSDDGTFPAVAPTIIIVDAIGSNFVRNLHKACATCQRQSAVCCSLLLSRCKCPNIHCGWYMITEYNCQTSTIIIYYLEVPRKSISALFSRLCSILGCVCMKLLIPPPASHSHQYF